MRKGSRPFSLVVAVACQCQSWGVNPPAKIAFLDRDGTLNIDPGYLSHPDQMSLYPGVAQALRLLKNAGFHLVVVSNQSGIGRGLITPNGLSAIHTRMNEILWTEAQVRIDEFAICPHHPDQNCECRKPRPTLLIEAAIRLQVELSQTIMIGDKRTDVEAGLRAGCRYTIQVLTGAGLDERKQFNPLFEDAHFLANDLAVAARWVLSQPF